jgi:hypothetical protein
MGGIYRGEPSFLNAKKRELARDLTRVLRLSCSPSPITIRMSVQTTRPLLAPHLSVPVNIDQVPVNIDQVPVNIDQVPVNIDQVPVNIDQVRSILTSLSVEGYTYTVNIDQLSIYLSHITSTTQLLFTHSTYTALK